MTRGVWQQKRVTPVAAVPPTLALALALPALLILITARPARADGAFPDSLGILAPADRPHDLVLATNFGVVTSVDDGQTWTWSCEQDKTAFGTQYQLSAPPLDRMFARSQVGLVFSDDRACSWTASSGAVGGGSVTDAFPDPTNPNRVLAVVMSSDADGGLSYRVLESADRGATFASVRYTAAGGEIVTGIEISRSTPATLYMTLVGAGAGDGGNAGASVLKLAKSTDSGASWQSRDLTAALGSGARSVRLIAIDPDNAGRVYLRVGDAGGERLAITDDGGATARVPLTIASGVMTAFARPSAGTFLVAGKSDPGPVMFRSSDGAATFQPLPPPPTLLGLAARGALVYGAADTLAETEGVFVSADQGTSWQPLLSFDQIQAIDPCVKALCQDDCQLRAGLGQWSFDLCDAVPSPRPVDGGGSPGGDAAAADGSPGAGADGHVTDSGAADGSVADRAPRPDAAAAVAAGSGCHCAAGSTAQGVPTAGLPAVAGAMLVVWSRRRRR